MKESRTWISPVLVILGIAGGILLLLHTPLFGLPGMVLGPGWDQIANILAKFALIGAVIAAVIALSRWFSLPINRENSGNRPFQDSIEILRQRYARGELTREEYYQILNDLERK
jgi:putative membrane protein